MTSFLFNGPAGAPATLLMAPGAGAPMTNAWMERVAALAGEAGLGVARFDFTYMAARADTGARRPPPRAEALVAEYRAAVEGLLAQGGVRRLLIGGKSLGGRVASLAADALHAERRIAGLVCLGYPFHPPDKPAQLRTRHLQALACPTLIVQGERDPFGGRDEVAGYGLSPAIRVHWIADGDHDMRPRRGSGATLAGNLAEAVRAVAEFARSIP